MKKIIARLIKMGHNRYDVIIVGAGPAGSSAAILCAQNNLSVALIEKGKFPGSKNMFGGTIYSDVTAKIIPEFWKEAPLERAVASELLYLMEPSSFVQMGYSSYNFLKAPYNTFTIIRSRFDKWLAGKAEEAGAHLMNETLVEDLLYEKDGLISKKVGGIVLSDGSKIYSDIVILAEGAQGDLARKAGLRKKINSTYITLYVKEILSLPKEVIEARFNLEKDEGINIGMIGYPTAGTVGKGGIWTNKDSISIIVGSYLNQMIENGLNPYQLLIRLKEHPRIKRLLAGAKTVEYLSKIIPKGGYRDIPSLYDDGILIAGDAGMLVSGRHGTDVAMLTGKYAAETTVQAKAKGDFSKKALSSYASKIQNSFFYQNLKNDQIAINYKPDYSDSDFLISQMINEVAHEFFSEGDRSQKEKYNTIINEIKKVQPIKKTVDDFYQAIRNWRL
ncbi:FAD-dependent oxidoreductase [Natronospora cellulosivora (SeqCode)]